MNGSVEWSGRAAGTGDERRISASRESNVETSSLLLVSLSLECLVHETVIMSCQSFCCRVVDDAIHVAFCRCHRSCCWRCYFCGKSPRLNIYFSDLESGNKTRKVVAFVSHEIEPTYSITARACVCVPVDFIGVKRNVIRIFIRDLARALPLLWLCCSCFRQKCTARERDRDAGRERAMRHTANQVWNWISQSKRSNPNRSQVVMNGYHAVCNAYNQFLFAPSFHFAFVTAAGVVAK